MTESHEEYIALTPDFKKPDIGDIVEVMAVDWGQIVEEVSGRSEFSIVRGSIYGKVVACDDERISLAFQVFDSGNLRGVLSIPWCTVLQVTILQHVGVTP